jgi:hypothetical protein
LSDVSVVFASADEATKPIVASDNASARSFLIFLSPIVQKLKAKHLLLLLPEAYAGELGLF